MLLPSEFAVLEFSSASLSFEMTAKIVVKTDLDNSWQKEVVASEVGLIVQSKVILR